MFCVCLYGLGESGVVDSPGRVVPAPNTMTRIRHEARSFSPTTGARVNRPMAGTQQEMQPTRYAAALTQNGRLDSTSPCPRPHSHDPLPSGKSPGASAPPVHPGIRIAGPSPAPPILGFGGSLASRRQPRAHVASGPGCCGRPGTETPANYRSITSAVQKSYARTPNARMPSANATTPCGTLRSTMECMSR